MYHRKYPHNIFVYEPPRHVPLTMHFLCDFVHVDVC